MVTDDSTTICSPARKAPRTLAASSVSGLRVKRSPSSLTSGCTPSSTEDRSPRESRSATAPRSSSSRTWAWSPRSSTRPPSVRSRVISRSVTPATRPPEPPCGRTPSRRSVPPRTARSRSGTTATWSTPPSSPSWSPTCPKENGRATQVAATNDTDLVTALLAGQVDDDGKPLTIEEAATQGPPAGQGRLLARLHGRAHALRRPRPAGHPPAGPRPPGARLGRRLRVRRPRHLRRQLRPRDRAGRVRRHRRERPAHLPIRGSEAQGLCLRVRLPGAPRHRHRRPERLPLPRGDGPEARRGSSRRGRPGHSDPGVRHPRRDRLRGGVRHPLRRRAW